MKLQMDTTKRVVAVANLHAMCARISGTCHTFRVAGANEHRVSVRYSNPDEYGSEEPITAVLPAYMMGLGSNVDDYAVILDPLRYVGCTGKNEEAWQAFHELWDCPELFQDEFDGPWHTRYEIMVKRYPEFRVTSEWIDSCTQRWFCASSRPSDMHFHPSWRDAQDCAVKQMRAKDEQTRIAKEASHGS
jgi:hypothetical protein